MAGDFERTIRGKSLKNETVDLDGTEFIDCKFERCRLTYSGGGLFLFDNTSADRCTLVFAGPAERTLFALASMYNTGLAADVEQLFAMIRNPLGDTKQ